MHVYYAPKKGDVKAFSSCVFAMMVGMFQAEAVRKQFPALRPDVIYMDSACMAIKPEAVIAAMDRYYREYPACAGRSVHRWGERVTKEVEATRASIARFLGARKGDTIVFTRNTTEAINLVANAFPFRAGDVVLTTDKEHNSNLIPWQMLARTRGIVQRAVLCKDSGIFDMDAYKKALADGNVRMVALGMTSNWDGMSVPAKEIVKLAHEHGALVLFDAAQSVQHEKIDVQSLGCDFLAASGHKMYGPTGTGFLYAKQDAMGALSSFVVGGGTVADVSLHSYILLDGSARFEAGLQDYAGIIGLGAAVSWLESLDRVAAHAYELALAKQLREGLAKFSGITLYGDGSGSIVSFIHTTLDPERIAVMLEEVGGIMVRSGRHCNHVWAARVGAKKGTVRASFAMYNTKEEVEKFLETMEKIGRIV